MNATNWRRSLVLAVAIAIGAVALVAGHARADDAVPVIPVCTTGEDVLTSFQGVPVSFDVIGRPDSAQGFANALADYFQKPHVPIGSIFIFASQRGVAVFGFDAEGCIAAAGTMRIDTFNAVAERAGIPTLPEPPDPKAI
jgi:hypothetical protein